jgi:hypothetical protein
MYKKRQEINTGEYDLPIPDDSPPASEPSLHGTIATGEGWRVSRVVLRQTYSRRAEIDSASLA